MRSLAALALVGLFAGLPGCGASGCPAGLFKLADICTAAQYLKSSNAGMSDAFGYRVALSGDTLAVAAITESSSAAGVNGNQDDNSAEHSGAVYVFQRTGDTWVQQAYLKASNPGSGDWFGSSLALSGDTLAVGALFEASSATGINGNQADNSAKDSGAVYVFQRTGSTWAQQAYLKASNTGAADLFGWSVGLYGDTLAVGAIDERSKATGVNGDQTDNSILNAGAVYVFQRSGSTWAQQAYLKSSVHTTEDNFGSTLAVWGDTLAVSATGDDSNAMGVDGKPSGSGMSINSGAVYVFQRSGGTWAQQAYVKSANAQTSLGFSASVALWNDTLVIGTINDSSTATNLNGDSSRIGEAYSGAAYVFKRSGGTWAQQTYVKAFNTAADAGFGMGVALSADTLVVGAPGEAGNAKGVNQKPIDLSAQASGAAYVFRNNYGN